MTEQRLSGRAVVLLAAGFMVLFVGGGSRFAIGLTLKPMAEDLDWSRGTLGLAVGLFLFVNAICLFISGRLADRISPRYILGGGLAISALGIGLMSQVVEPWQALVLYGVIFAIGNGIASITPIGVMISRWFPGRTGLAYAAAISGVGLGQLVMIAVLAVVLMETGWRSVYVWIGVVNLVLAPLVFVAMAGGDDRAGATSAANGSKDMSVGDAVRTRRFWVLATIYAACGFQDFFVATHVVAFAQDRGVDALLAGNLLAFMGVTGLAGVIVAGAWSDRSGPVRATIACFVLRIAVFGLILFDQRVGSVAAFALIYGITFWATAPLAMIFARDAFGLKHIGALSGLITMIHHMAGGIGAYAGAVLFDAQGSYDVAFAVMFVLSVVSVGVSLRLRAS
jgi:MFS family permease